MISFIAEIKQIKSRKLISNDIEYSVELRSADQQVLDLGKIAPDQVVKVKVTIG